MRLQLVIPAQSTVVDPRVERNPAKLRVWLDSLPYANPRTTLEKLGESVASCNRQQIEAPIRVQLLDQYSRACTALLEGLKDPGGSQQISERQRTINSLRKRLIKEMVFGYKTILMDLAKKQSRVRIENSFGNAFFGAMHYLALSMLHAYQVYEAPPPNSWRELNHLYQYGDYLDLLSRGSASAYSEAGCETMEKLYYRIALVELSDPYHMPQNMVTYVWSFLPQLLDFVYTMPPDDAIGGDGQFMIDLKSDRGAQPLADLGGLESSNIIIICTDGIIEHLTELRDNIEIGIEGDETHELPYATQRKNLGFFAHLLKYWWQKPERKHQRDTKLAWMQVAFGLTASHQALKNGNNSVIPKPQDEDEDIEVGAIQFGLPASVRHIKHTTVRCQLSDHSEGGFALLVPIGHQNHIRVGDILTLQSGANSAAAKTHIGVVRWFSNMGESEIKVGVQHLSSQAKPAMIKPVGDSDAIDQACLLICDGEQRDSERCLIAPHGLFNQERELKISQGEEVSQGRADRLIESTTTFDLFTCLVR